MSVVASMTSRTCCQQLDRGVKGFFCTVLCACNTSKQCKHLLVLSATTFAFPAYLLLRQGSFFLGVSTTALLITSLIYHSIHKGWIRAADVLLVHVVAISGTTQAVIAFANASLWSERLPFLLAVFGVFGTICINTCSFFYTPDGRLIALQWHVVLHLLTTASLVGVAVGFGLVW